MVTEVAGGIKPQVQSQDIQPDATGFGSALQGVPLQMGPPGSPEESEQRKAGWNSFIDRMMTDPQMQGLMFAVGARMAQPTPAGQTGLGHVAQSISGGMDQYYRVLQQQEAIRQEQERGRREAQALEQRGEIAAADRKSREEIRAADRKSAEQIARERNATIRAGQPAKGVQDPWMLEFDVEDVIDFAHNLPGDAAGNVSIAQDILRGIQQGQRFVWSDDPKVPGQIRLYDRSGRALPGNAYTRHLGGGEPAPAPAPEAAASAATPPPAFVPETEGPPAPPTVAEFKGLSRYVRQLSDGTLEYWELIDGKPERAKEGETTVGRGWNAIMEWLNTTAPIQSQIK